MSESKRPGPGLQAQALQKAYGRRVVLAGVDLAVESGTLVGIVGENGAGKSTLLRILAGDLAPDHGTVMIHGALGFAPKPWF